VVRRGYLRKILIVVALAVSVMHPTTLNFWLGTGIFLLGALLHLWTKGCLVRNEEITTCGPYRFVRHPFYVANALVDLGICVIANNFWLYIIYPVLFVAAYAYTIRREEKYLAERHGEVWQAYRKRVPMCIPYRRPAPAAPGRGFRWENLVREGEIPRFLRLLAYPVVFDAWVRLINMGGVKWNQIAAYVWKIIYEGIGVFTTIELVAIIALFLAAGILRRRLRPAQAGPNPAIGTGAAAPASGSPPASPPTCSTGEDRR
jgi:isoprenylcysteine carboxyl methyltransferase (ICMT) family protein YpbQ